MHRKDLWSYAVTWVDFTTVTPHPRQKTTTHCRILEYTHTSADSSWDKINLGCIWAAKPLERSWRGSVVLVRLLDLGSGYTSMFGLIFIMWCACIFHLHVMYPPKSIKKWSREDWPELEKSSITAFIPWIHSFCHLRDDSQQQKIKLSDLYGKKKGLLCLLIGLLGKQNIIDMSSPITYYSMHKATMINIHIAVTDHSN